MTALTTILGLLPLALGLGEGTEMNQPMGIAVIGGLISSTFLTLYVVPVIYSLFDRQTMKRAVSEKINEGPLYWGFFLTFGGSFFYEFVYY